MSALFISLLTLVLLLISAFIVLIVLMQRTSQSGGMGAALGGGAAESAFGADTNNVLTKGTIYGIIAFFVIGLVLYLFYQAQASEAKEAVDTATLLSAAPEEATSSDAVAEEALVAESVEAAALPASSEGNEDSATTVAPAIKAKSGAQVELIPNSN
jgi:preprotein translocase subunit SecG